MLINKACCAVRKACGTGNGDGVYEHVKIEKRGITATDGAVLARLTLPDFSDPHPKANLAIKSGEKVLHKSDVDIIKKMLSDGDANDPSSAALITESGALRLKGDNILEFDVSTAQGKLAFENIDFPDVSEIIPERGRPGSNTIRVDVLKLAKIVAVAKAAGVEELDIEVPKDDTQPIRVDGINGDSQLLLGVIMPVTAAIEE